MYPLGAPTINGSKITLEQYLKNPTRVARDFQELSKERFLGDFIFGAGPADGGAVIYNQLVENSLYAADDPQEIAPGDEFPLTEVGELTPLVAKVAKRGSAAVFTYEEIRRDSRDVLNRKMVRLRNTSIRKHDVITMLALNTTPAGGVAIRGTAAAKLFTDPTADPMGDLFTGCSAVEQADMGYIVDTAILHPIQALALLNRKDIRDQLPKENTSVNPILTGRLPHLGSISNWIVSNRQAAGTIHLLQAKIAGSMRDEIPLYTRVVDQPDRERTLIMAGRVSVPIVTDPLCVYRLTGC